MPSAAGRHQQQAAEMADNHPKRSRNPNQLAKAILQPSVYFYFEDNPGRRIRPPSRLQSRIRSRLFDHFVGAGEQCWWHREPEDETRPIRCADDKFRDKTHGKNLPGSP